MECGCEVGSGAVEGSVWMRKGEVDGMDGRAWMVGGGVDGIEEHSRRREGLETGREFRGRSVPGICSYRLLHADQIGHF